MNPLVTGSDAGKPVLRILASTLLALALPAAASAGAARFDPWVEDRFRSEDRVEFIVRLEARADLADLRGVSDGLARRAMVVDRLRQTANQSQSGLRARLDQLGVEYRPFWIANAILVKADRAVFEEIRQRPDVAYIHANPRVRMDLPRAEPTAAERPEEVEWNIELIGAPDVWARGFTGEGAVVGGQDTGYEWDHPALIGKYRGWNGATADHNYNWHDAIHVDNAACDGDSAFPCDDNGHGTHTMGTMVGDDGGGNRVGVAPGAKWIGCRNMDEGNGTPASYIECFEWFAAPTDLNGENPDPSKAPHVINNSWSCPPSEGCNDVNILLDTVNNTVAAGILVVVSAGNDGAQGCSTVSTPAAIYEPSFTVGSTTIEDTISSFSSRGPVAVDGSNRLKPDISAPGQDVRSSYRGDYAELDGTSMAGPHVAGLAALLISAEPGLAGDPSTLKSLTELNAVKLTTAQTCGGVPGDAIPNNTFGYGRIDAAASVLQLLEEFFKQGFESTH